MYISHLCLSLCVFMIKNKAQKYKNTLIDPSHSETRKQWSVCVYETSFVKASSPMPAHAFLRNWGRMDSHAFKFPRVFYPSTFLYLVHTY